MTTDSGPIAPTLVTVEGGQVVRNRTDWFDYTRFPGLQRLYLVGPEPKGGLLWAQTHFGPASDVEMHGNAESRQFIIVIQGPVTLLLRTGETTLGTGDCLVLPPHTDHGWTTPPDSSATIAIVSASGPVSHSDT
jgi:quercetin dioxygenase-like cupin family protein